MRSNAQSFMYFRPSPFFLPYQLFYKDYDAGKKCTSSVTYVFFKKLFAIKKMKTATTVLFSSAGLKIEEKKK